MAMHIMSQLFFCLFYPASIRFQSPELGNNIRIPRFIFRNAGPGVGRNTWKSRSKQRAGY